MTVEEKYVIAESVLLNRLGCYFEKYGYEFTDKKSGGDGEMKSLQLVFINDGTLRVSRVYYLPFDFSGNASECVTVFIDQVNINVSYSLEKLFKYYNIPFDPNHFCLLNYAGSFKEQLEQCCDYCIGLFDNYLQEWIKGDKWADIPFDWGSYK